MTGIWRQWMCALSVIAGLSACRDSDSAKIKAAALAEGCLINTDCAAPLVCAFRRCHTECEDSRDCEEGQRCVASDRPFRVCQLDDERDCTSNIDCPLRMVCGIDGECRDGCGTYGDCIAGQVCTSGTCADEDELGKDGRLPERPGLDGAAVSRPCSYSSDCSIGLVCRNGACIQECREDRDCPLFTTCEAGRCALGELPFGGNSGGAGGARVDGGSPTGCLFNSDCPVGRICDAPNCRCECRENRDCFGGERCDGCACVPGSSGADASAGGNGGSGGTNTGGSGGADPEDSGAGGGGTDAGSLVRPIECGSRDATGATIAPAEITTNTTWGGVIHMQRNVLVKDGAVLTLEAGTTVLADTGSTLEVGWNTHAATVRALGTAAAPIRLCSTQGDAGGWGGVIVRSNTSASSVLRNVLISDGGATTAGLLLQADITLDAVQVRNSGSDGVWASDFVAGSRALTVDGATGFAVVLTGQGAATRFPLGGSLVGNGTDAVRVDFSAITTDTTFYGVGVPYVQSGNLQVQDSSTLTIAAGVDYRVAADHQIDVGWNNAGSTLRVNGTATQPVTFRGQTPESGFWRGIIVRPNVTAASHLVHTRILHAGSSQPALDIDTPITLDNVLLDLNAEGIELSDEGLNDDSVALTVKRTEGVPLTAAPNALVTLPTDSALAGNDVDRVDVAGGYYDAQGVIPNLGIPYFLQASVNVRDGARFEVAPGTEFVANVGVELDIGWNSSPATFIAEGTAASPIVFRGLDTTAGYWDGLVFRVSTLSSSRLDYVEVHGAGTVNAGALELYKEISVTHTTITGSAGYGIRHTAGFTTDYSSTNTFSNNTQGDVTAR